MIAIHNRIAASGSTTVKKGATGKQLKISDIEITATAVGTVTFSDGETSYVIDVDTGINHLCQELVFKADTDVTITAATATVTVFANANHS